MDVFWLFVYWIVWLLAVYVSYTVVREVVQAVLKRPLSILGTLAVVFAGAYLLVEGIDRLTNSYIIASSTYLGTSGSTVQNGQYTPTAVNGWPALMSLALVAVSSWLMASGVDAQIGRGSCPHCGANLAGHSSCSTCGWGRVPLLDATVRVARQAAQASQARTSVPGTGTTAQPLTSTAARPETAAGAPASYCADCGSPLQLGQTFCTHCGTTVDES